MTADTNTEQTTQPERAPKEMRFCEKEGQETEWRQYKIERTWLSEDEDKPTGPYRYQWRCYSCLRKSDNKAKARKRRQNKMESQAS